MATAGADHQYLLLVEAGVGDYITIAFFQKLQSLVATVEPTIDLTAEPASRAYIRTGSHRTAL